jgi:hypothetical protein
MKDRFTNEQLATVCRSFSAEGRFIDGRPHGTGHINDTFAITLGETGARRRVILQRVNRHVFKDVPALMENFARVTTHLASKAAAQAAGNGRRATLTLVPTIDGGNHHQDGNGDYWRMSPFIERTITHEVVRDPRDAREAARAYGEFQRLVADLPGPRLHETIPFFHDTPRRFAALERAIQADAAGRVPLAEREIDFARRRQALAGMLLDLHARGEAPERITHNDTKINNVMFDDTTGRAICVVDLDTVMPGLALYDFGDMARSATNAAAEDEVDLSRVHMQLPVFEGLVRGFIEGVGPLLTPAERAHLASSARLITFEIGIRFLTDFLEGDVYFKTHRVNHNLDRCRCQFALVRSMEEQAGAMESAVEQLTQ